MSASEKAYAYEPLPGDDWIRLLRILPGKGPLQGQLIPARVTSGTHYEALSYTWGNAEKTASLYIGGDMIRLTANCASAIRNLRSSNEPRIVWIDAVCINQDDPEEKGHEVNMMGDIYSRATRTIVYLGPGDGTVRLLRTPQILDQGGLPVYPDRDRQDAFEDARLRLLRRDWFHRKWIIQEVLLSQDLVVQCGPHNFTWRELEVLDRSHGLEILRLTKKYLHPSSMSSGTVNGHDWDPKAKAAWDEMFEQGEVVDRNAHAANVPRSSKYRAPGTGFLMPPQLFDILCATSEFDCKEPRDRVFAILSLFARKLQIKTSYVCPEEEIYHSLNQELLALGDTRMLWIEDRDSWRVRWSSVLSTLSEFVNAHGERRGKNRQQTDIGRLWREVGQEGRIGIDSSVSTSIWQTSGVLLGTISTLSTAPLERQKSRGAMSKGPSEHNFPMWQAALDSLGLISSDCEDSLHPLAHIHQRNRNQLDWFRKWTLDLFGRASLEANQQDCHDKKILARAMATHHGDLSFCNGMSLFQCAPSSTESGQALLGLTSQRVLKDDYVFFLPGTSCPFLVLRPQQHLLEFVSLCWFGPLRLFPSCFGKALPMFDKENWHSLEIV